jgi:predicted acylesterase/phospholipase RssA
MKRVLAIDGGGMHGIIAAAVLRHIEDRCGMPVHRLFDLVTGTSTGGIIALGLCKPEPLTAAEVLTLYTEHGREIFPRAGRWTRSLFGPKYPAAPLERMLRAYLGNRLVSDCPTPCMVTAYDIEQRETRFIKSWRQESMPLWAAARATSAAPTFFPPYGSLIDGGVFINNPALSAYAAARRMWPDEKQLVVSIGTGGMTRPIDPSAARRFGIFGWSKRLLSIMMDGQAAAVEYQLNQFPLADHRRLQAPLVGASDDAEDARPKQIEGLLSVAATLIERADREIDTLCDELLGAARNVEVLRPAA